jgi:hypothetical protein
MGSMSTEGLPDGMAALSLSGDRTLIGPTRFIERIQRDLEAPPTTEWGDWDFDPDARLGLAVKRPESL